MSRVLRLAGTGAGHVGVHPYASGRLRSPDGAVGLALRECGWAMGSIRSLQCGRYFSGSSRIPIPDGALSSSWPGTALARVLAPRLPADTCRSARVVQTWGLARPRGDTSACGFSWLSGPPHRHRLSSMLFVAVESRGGVATLTTTS